MCLCSLQLKSDCIAIMMVSCGAGQEKVEVFLAICNVSSYSFWHISQVPYVLFTLTALVS